MLNSGLVVPCGKCLLCRSARRQDWSVRVQLHAASYDKMPLFVTLTYDNEHLVYGADDKPTLVRSDLSKFIKAYRDRYNLYNTDWSYFGCGEMGDKFGRPHYHLLIFGDDALYDLFEKSFDLASARLEVVWKKGLVHVCLANWSGVHYVTKYVLKDHENEVDPSEVQRPFTICSQGIGLKWLDSLEACRLRYRILQLQKNVDKLNNELSHLVYLTDDPKADQIRLAGVYHDYAPYFPDFNIHLPSGETAYLPRELRRRLVGSFEYFKDNPLWLWQHLCMMLRSLEYYNQFGEYDLTSSSPMSDQMAKAYDKKIRQRLIINHHKKLNK